MIYKAFKDSNGSSVILVVGLGYYVPVMELENKKEEIAELKIDLRKSKEFNCGLATENNELKAMVNALKDGVTHFNKSHGDLNPLLAAYVDTPRQCLTSVKADAALGFKDEMLAASTPMLHPHIEGVFAVYQIRLSGDKS